MYRLGFGVEKSNEKANKYHELAAEKNDSIYKEDGFNNFLMYKMKIALFKHLIELAKQKDTFSLLVLAFYYEINYFSENTQAKAKEIYEYLAEQNNDVALYKLGMAFVDNQDYIKAKHYLKLSAKQNNSYALYELGLIYKNGKGVEKNYRKAKKYFERSFEQNNFFALLELGEIYEYGLGVEKDYQKAIELYETCSKLNKINASVKAIKFYKANRTNDTFRFIFLCYYYEYSVVQIESRALMKLGNLYLFGLEVKQSYEVAIRYYDLAAQQDCCEVLYELGLLYYNGSHVEKNFTKAKEYFELAVIQNHPESLFYLGLMHKRGYGCEQNFEKAKEYYELSAKYNCSEALNNLENMYLNGEGVQKDYMKAKKYYEQAAEKGDSASIFNLGYLYLHGLGVEQDYLKAREYFESAAKQNEPLALHDLGYLYYNGLGVKQNYVEAKEYFELAAKFNIADSFDFLGDIYFYGLGVAKNFSLAKENYESAVKYGNQTAIVRLGILYYERNDNEQDYNIAKKKFELASEKNIQSANYYLGRMYELGKGVEKNLAKAKECYESAAKLNYHYAIYRLGIFYERGISVQKDQSKAIEYYKRAANQGNDNAILQLVVIYSNKGDSDICINNAITYLNRILKMGEDQQLRKKFVNNANLYIAYNYFGLIHLFEYQDIKKATEYIYKSACEEYPRGQNNYGLFLQFKKNKSEAIYFFEKSSEGGCEIASYNLGYLYEADKDIEKSIKYYIKASKDADNEFEFRGRKIFDQRYEQSKKFIICLTNLHLVKHYFVDNSNLSRKYFVKAIKMLTKDTYKFSFNPNDNPFSYIKDFIFNYPDFEFSEAKKALDEKVKKVGTKYKNKKHLIKSLNNNKNKILYSNIKEKGKFNNINEKMFDLKNISKDESNESCESLSDLFDYIIQNAKNKQLFIDEIQKIIDDMNKILYTPPYNFLFGRMKLRYTKQNNDHICYQKNINDLFYDGFDIPI